MDKNIIEKARQKVQRNDGDIHPNGKWVWSSSANGGKGDWRTIKGKNGDKESSDKSSNKKTDDNGGGNTLSGSASKQSDSTLKRVVDDPNASDDIKDAAKKELDSRKNKENGGGVSNQNKSRTEPSGRNGLENYEDEEGWYLDENHPMIKKNFRLDTKSGRIAYDKFVDTMKRKDPNYRSPVKVIQGMNRMYANFLVEKGNRFAISAGGAGIGKTYGFKALAKKLGMVEFNPEDHKVGDDDYDIFEATDVKSPKQLVAILKNHNGKIILFDDTDSILTRKDMSAMMKKATASTGNRVIGSTDDPTSNFLFTGRIMIMTNKSLSGLSKESEDAKAVISRAMLKRELNFTVNEQLELLKTRIHSFEFPDAPRLDDEEEDRKEREYVYDVIKSNVDKIDPAKFTTRDFQSFVVNLRSNGISKKIVTGESGEDFVELLGDDFDDVSDVFDLFKSEEVSELSENSLIKAETTELSVRRYVAMDDGVFYDESEVGIVKALDEDEFYKSINITETEALGMF